MENINEISNFLRAGKDLLEIFKSLRSLLPQGQDSEKAQEQINRAEKALRASEAKLAKALGYHLCQCTFPPQIMLWQQSGQVFVCPNCTYELDPNRRGQFAPSRLVRVRR